MSSSEDPAEQAPNPDPNRTSNQTDGDNVQERNAFAKFFAGRTSKLRAATFGGVGAFFCAWGAFYYNSRHAPPWIAVSLFFVGGIFGALTAWQVAKNFGKSDRIANRCLAGVILVVIGLAGLDIWFEYRPIPSREAKPRVRLVLNTGESPNANLPLTNCEFVFKTSLGARNHMSDKIALATPLRAGASNLILKFTAFGDSEVRAEDVIVTIAIDKRAHPVADKGWELMPVESSSNADCDTFFARIVFPLNLNVGAQLPNITVAPDLFGVREGLPFKLLAFLRADLMDETTVACLEYFPARGEISKPQVLPISKDNDNGIMHLKFPTNEQKSKK
jgi:hypothetical protein